MKRILSLLLSAVLCISLSAAAFAGSSSPDKSDLDDVLATITYPKKNAYLEEYLYAVVMPTGNNYCINAYSSYNSSKRVNTIEEDEEVTVLAKQSGRVCVIVESTEKAYWVNPEYLNFDYTLSDHPCKDDLNSICSTISFPKSKDFLSEYQYAEAAPTGGATMRSTAFPLLLRRRLLPR